MKPKRQPATPRPRTRGRDVVRWFAGVMLLCIGVFGAGSAMIFSGFLTHQMLMRDAELSGEFLESIIAAERTWSYFADPASTEAREPLESFFNHVSKMPNVVRANVFARDGTVLWSSNPAMIGRRYSGNAQLDAALDGRVSIETGTVQKSEHERLNEAVGSGRFVEAYLPVYDEARERVIGVVEIYRLPDTLFQTIDKDIRLVWLGTFLVAALLYASLLWMALRAQRVIAEQQSLLVEAEALSAIGAVASAVAHGIRNPLAAIRSSAELAATEDAAGAAACLADIQREADRMEAWMRDLLLQARHEHASVDDIDVNELVGECLVTFAQRAERQGVAVATDYGALPPVRGEPAALGQAIENLVANAIEAMPDGGRLVLATRVADGGRQVEITVADSGIGLPAGGAPGSLFFSTKARGTGLGLLLTRRILERHAGALTLGRRKGGGTRAVISLPVPA